jgi:endonuclease III
MGIFQSKASKEIDLALNYLNERMIKHYADWDRTLKLNVSARAASEQPLEEVVNAVRIMWRECFARSLYLGIDCRHQYDLVKIKTPLITSVISESKFAEIEFQQAKRIIQLMQQLVEDISDIKPEYRDTLESLKREPQVSKIQAEAQALMNRALEKGKFDTRNERFVIKGL